MRAIYVSRYVLTITFMLLTKFSFAAPILNISQDGQLLGARNLPVLGFIYNVEFVDGTCADNFIGCDELSDLPITDIDLARAAGEALFDFVFIDSPLGNFNTDPSLTFGCNSPISCGLNIPYNIVFTAGGFPVYQAIQAANHGPDSTFNDIVGGPVSQGAGTDFAPRNDSTGFDSLAFASFTRVPEPPTYLMFLLGSLLIFIFQSSRTEVCRIYKF